MQYIGNADAAEDLPHGNAKKPINFLPVAKALTTQLEEKTSKLADICAETVHEQEQFQPRNKNQKRYFERKSQLNTDSFLVLHEMAYTFPDFIWKIATYPDLTVTFGLPQFFNLLETSCTSDIMFSYDTTFNLGDFYLTTLVVQLHSFAEKPIIPIAFMLHERKFQSLHEDFCASVYEMMPNRIKGQAFNACTDGEAGCSNAISKVFPSWNAFQCWNHIVTDVEFWLKKHGATNDELAVYKMQMRSLLASETDEDYKMTNQSYQETWSQAFRDYYVAYVEPRVCSSYRHRLKECGLKADSITTNNSESLNAVLKRYQNFHEVAVDRLVFSMYRLQIAYGASINKSVRGFGPFVPIAPSAATSLHLPQCPEYDSMLTDLCACTFGTSVPETVSDIARSLQVVHVPQQQCFSVAAASGNVHSVRLFPKELCTCPIKTGCAHIIAAKYSVSLQQTTVRNVNLGLLRRNSRKKCDKKSGRKRPRRGDITFVAAPDSALAEASTFNIDTSFTQQDSPTFPSVQINRKSAKTSSSPTTTLNSRKKIVTFAEPNISPSVERAPGQLNDRSCIPQQDSQTFPSTRMVTPKSRKKYKKQLKFVSPDTPKKTETFAERNISPSIDCARAEQIDIDCIPLSPEVGHIRAEDVVTSTPVQSTKYMTADDWRKLDSSRLSDNVINATQLLLKNVSQDSGLRDTVLVSAHSTHIEENAKFVQIVHDAPREHWIVATNRGCGADTIRIYCSIGMKPSDKCMQSILCCVRSKAEKVHIQVMNIAKQQGGKDCGLYSIAVATLLMFEKDPTAVVFKQECMHDHLTSCLRGEAMSEFPCTTNRVVRHKIAIKYDVAVYCICRGGGFSMERMISCDNCHSWYHIRCVGMTDEQFAVYATDRSKRYHCMNCMN